MSQENVEVVRGFNAPREGENLIPVIREALERLGPDPAPEAILALWGEDPGWRYAHPDIDWDLRATGAVGSAARGPREVGAWWAEWVEAIDAAGLHRGH